jgi:putative ABC transport system permease protein
MKYNGLFRIAYKLLVNDTSKFTALLLGITFAVFLMLMMISMFAGILDRSAATVNNIGASIWVMDPAVNTVVNTIPVPDYLLDAVRSIDGVKYAVPLYSGGALAKLRDGNYQSVSVIGLDDSSLVGRPPMEKGNIRDIFAENSFLVVHDAEYVKLENPTIGTEFEINDHLAVISGIAKVSSSGLFGVPTLYTTYNRAIQYLPNARFTMSYILVEPKKAEDIPIIKSDVSRLGYLALTKKEFEDKNANFFKYQTGAGTNIMIMTVVSFIIGLSITGQTFYTFILENLEKFGALKAIGVKSHELVIMILFQALFTSLTGYGMGVGLCALVIKLARLRLPDYAAMITYSNLSIAFAMVLLIAGISSYFGVRKVLNIEPFEIFRG